MPVIKSSAELRNSYSAVSKLCHEYDEPVFITVNGRGDLAVQSIEAYERMRGRLELYEKLIEGIHDIDAGDTMSFDEAMRKLRMERKK